MELYQIALIRAMPVMNLSAEASRKSLAVAALSAAPVAIGCALGLMLSNHLRRRHRIPLATAFLVLGTAAVAPTAVEAMNRLIRSQMARNGADRTLDGIRSHDGLPYDAADASGLEIGGEERSAGQEPLEGLDDLGEVTMVDFPRAAHGKS